MVAGKSPEWLPSGFTEKVKYKNGRKIKYYYNVATGAKYYSKKDVLSCVKSDKGPLGTTHTKNGDDKGLSSNNNVDAMLAKTNGSPEWLPNGWTMEERTRQSGSHMGSVYKVYSDLSSGNKFYSRAAVTRYLSTLDHTDTPPVQNKLDNVDAPSPDMSLQHISMKNTDSIPEKKRKGNSFETLDNVDAPSQDISLEHKSMTNTGSIPEKKWKGNSFKTVATETTAAEDLPPGWIKEIKTSKSGNKIRKDPYYTDPVSGYVFRSKLDALRYLKTNDISSCVCRPKKRELDDLNLIKNDIALDNVDAPSPEMSLQHKSMKNTDSIPEKKRKGNSFETLDNVNAPSPDMPLQPKSMTNTGSIPEKKRKGNPFETVATEITAAEDLPPGWIKEIKTSKSGNKIRKDPYYTDPVSGYVFRSKLDALRYLKTNDISSCACRPTKRELNDLKLIKNDIPSSNPASSEHKKLFFFGAVNGVGETSGTKALAETEAKMLKQTPDKNEYNSCENANKNAAMENKPGQENVISKKIQENPKADVRKSRKRKGLSVPSRASKRLAGSEPEMLSNSVLNERALRATTRTSGSEVDTSPSFTLNATASTPLASDIEPAKEAVENAVLVEETLQEIEPPKEVENPPQAIPEDEKASEKQQLDDSKKAEESSQLCYDFGDSWSDPLEFALKTLRGEISIEDTLAFPGCFDENGSIPYNHHQVAPNSESSKQNGDVDCLPNNSSPFNISFPSCSGFNSQSSAEAGKKDCPTKFNP